MKWESPELAHNFRGVLLNGSGHIRDIRIAF